MNGMAAFLGVPARLTALDTTLKVQNPAALSDKVENFADMEKALGGIDRFNLTRTPNFEPRRSAAVPDYCACRSVPLVYLPIQGGPVARVESWMSAMDGGTADMLVRNMNQRAMRQWKRTHKGHRSFTVLRHPLARAHSVFCDKILATGPGSYPKIRRILVRKYKLDLPDDDADWGQDDHYKAFSAFLNFVKGNLAGQTGVRVDSSWCSQIAALQGFGGFVPPDYVFREETLEQDVAMIAERLGMSSVDLPAASEPEQGFSLAAIYDDALEQLCKSVYQRDYLMFGFDAWQAS